MDIIMKLDKASSKIAMFMLLLMVLKFVTKRLHMTKADRFLMKIHKPASYGLVISGLIHAVTSFRFFSEVGILPYALGDICLLSIVGVIYTSRGITKKIEGSTCLRNTRVRRTINKGGNKYEQQEINKRPDIGSVTCLVF